jgi:N-acylneuraminate cytidylyltransferase
VGDFVQRCVAIIPARGGSKGIPRKNLIDLGGKPLIAHTIEHAHSAPSIQRVIVSTDDDEIARVAAMYGAEVIRRPSQISGDTARSEEAIVHVLEELSRRDQYEPDLVQLLQATSPLRRPQDVQAAIDLLIREEADSLFSACRFHGFLWQRESDRWVSVDFDYTRRPRRQERPEEIMENGAIFAFKPWVLQKFNDRMGGKIAAYLMPAINSFELDQPEDVELIRYLMGGALRP